MANKKCGSKELTALEELEDMGFEILNNNKDKNGNYHNRKISIDVQFYEDGSWVVDSCMGKGQNATLGSGDNLIKILPVLKESKDIFLKAIKEIKIDNIDNKIEEMINK